MFDDYKEDLSWEAACILRVMKIVSALFLFAIVTSARTFAQARENPEAEARQTLRLEDHPPARV
jgi:hypothetical protein